MNVRTSQSTFDEVIESQERRLAYVIGNNDYDHIGDLRNAENDARLMSGFLRNEGYSVHEQFNIDKRGFEELLRKIARETDENTHVLIYFAGHGVQIGDSNYLIPSDAKMDDASEVSLQAVSLANIMEIAKARSRTLVIILDSCRNNPFEGRQLRQSLLGEATEAEQGFFAQRAPINSFLAFSTSPGMFAMDGTGENSPFTESLVAIAQDRRNETIERVMYGVRQKVYDLTQRRQVPWESTSLIEEFFLASQEKGLMLLSEVGGASGAEESTPLIVTAQLDPVIDIGSQLKAQLGTLPMRGLKLVKKPGLGEIDAIGDGTALEYMTYRPSLDSIPISDIEFVAGEAVLEDEFQIEHEGGVVDVQLRSSVHPCDFEAGDHIDPDGIGVARFPNEISPKKALDACKKAVAESPETGRFHFQLGRAYLALADLDNAAAAFERARELGHVRAYFSLGQVALGRITAEGGDLQELAPQEALDFFAEGAEKGDPYSMHSLGRQYLLFSNDDALRERGFRLLVRAAEMGHTFAMNALGQYFLDEERPEFDGARGLEFWRASAARKDIYGIANMARANRNGLGGMETNLEAAVALYKEAAAGGHPFAPTSLGILYATGRGTKKDPNAAVTNFDLALSRGDAQGGTNGAMMFLSGRAKGKAGDAAQRAAKAFQLNNTRAKSKAMEQLDSMTAREIDAGAQAIMVQLGAKIAVDGAFGPGSRAALAELEQQYGVDVPDGAQERLLRLAKLFWEQSAFRVDLY